MIVWRAFWRLILGPRPLIMAEWSDGTRRPIGFFDYWWIRRPPHELVRLEYDGAVIWESASASR